MTDAAGDVYSSAGVGSGYFAYDAWTSSRHVKLSSTTLDCADRQVTMTGQLQAIYAYQNSLPGYDGSTSRLGDRTR